MKRASLLIGALALLAPAAAPRAARADGPAPDAAAQITQTLLELDTALKAKDQAAATTAIKKLPALYKGTTEGPLRTTIAKDLAGVVKQTKLPDLRRTALDALVETEDGVTAWKGLQGAYPKDDVEDTERFNCEVVKAVGALHPDGAVDLLIETFKKGKQAELSAAAVTALGNYHKSKRRESILEEVVKAGKNMVPARGSGGKNPGPEAQARWAAVGSALGKALDTLTGTTVGDPQEWFKKVDEAKKNLKGLFKD